MADWETDSVVQTADWQSDPVAKEAPQEAVPEDNQPESETLGQRMHRFFFSPEGAQTVREGIQGAVQAVPQMALDTAKQVSRGVQFAIGDPQERFRIAMQELAKAKAQGQQIAEDIQSPFGTPEWLRGAGELAMIAGPLVGGLAGDLGEVIPRARPPIQELEPPPVQTNEDIKYASQEPSTTSVPVQPFREEMGGGTSLRQPGPAPEVRPPETGIVEGQIPEPAPQEVPQVAQPDRVTSIMNKVTDAERAEIGLPEASPAERQSWVEAMQEAQKREQANPMAGQNLVEELNAKARAIDATEDAQLVRRQIQARTEFYSAIDQVNKAVDEGDRAAANARLEAAREQLQAIYDADRKAGTKTAQGLAARQMMAREDYTLASMEARRRAANNGQPLSQPQLKQTAELQGKISELEQRLAQLERQRSSGQSFGQVLRETQAEARQPKFRGRPINEFLNAKAEAARQRIIARRGRLNVGVDPGALVDEAIIGASHIANGLVKFSDWSAQMVSDFGERIRPFLQDLWVRAKAYHNATLRSLRTPEEAKLESLKTRMAKQTIGVQAQLERGDLTKAERRPVKLDKAAFQMRANLQQLKNQFEREIAKEAYRAKTPAQKFWDHFVGVERAMKLSGPEVFGKLGVAAAVREALAPAEAGFGYAVSKVLPGLTKGTRYGADLGTLLKSELKAKAAIFTKGMQDAAQSAMGKETELEAIGGGRIKPDFWYNRIGQMHAAIKAPIKRAEFERSLTLRMAEAVKNGEDINHPEVMTRLANESVMDANRAIFQENTVVANFFSMLERQSPAAGRTARFLFPVVKIPVNLFKELVNLHVGAPVAATKIGMAYWRGIETLPVLEREAIVRQLAKGSIGGAALLYGYFQSDQIRKIFDSMPSWFQHTPIAMIFNEGSYLKKLQAGGAEAQQGQKELTYMAKTDIPFMYTVTDIASALDAHNSNALVAWINNTVRNTVVPQLLQQTAKYADKPGTFPSNIAEKPTYRRPANPLEAIKTGIPGLREQVPPYQSKKSMPRARKTDLEKARDDLQRAMRKQQANALVR